MGEIGFVGSFGGTDHLMTKSYRAKMDLCHFIGDFMWVIITNGLPGDLLLVRREELRSEL